jgi:hypothetical protein
MNRRELVFGVGAVGIGLFSGSSHGTESTNHPSDISAQVSGPEVSPSTVAGITLPNSQIALRATELSRSASPPYLFNHCVRTFLWGSLIGRALGHHFDEELLYVACVLHDLGLTDHYQGAAPFEIQGAESAREFLQKNGMSKESIEIVWDGIAMHASAIGNYKRPEIALVGQGAGADVLGPGPAQVKPEAAVEIHKAFPRLDFKSAFVKSCADVVRKYPRAASQGFMRDVRDRFIPDFHAKNFCDRLAEAPFSE